MYASFMITNFRECIKKKTYVKLFDIKRMKILGIVWSFILKLSYLMHIDSLNSAYFKNMWKFDKVNIETLTKNVYYLICILSKYKLIFSLETILDLWERRRINSKYKFLFNRGI